VDSVSEIVAGVRYRALGVHYESGNGFGTLAYEVMFYSLALSVGVRFWKRPIRVEEGWLSLVIEHNGDVYACDHCVYHQYKVGNIMDDKLPDMVEKSLQSGLGVLKEAALPGCCKECDVLAACQGGCPKHRFMKTDHDEPGLHYPCEGYRKFFFHIRKYLRAMATLLENGLPASRVMDAIKGPLVIKPKEDSRQEILPGRLTPVGILRASARRAKHYAIQLQWHENEK
jgi:radical SAM protein with 4Fe4S-binding SPASM domain